MLLKRYLEPKCIKLLFFLLITNFWYNINNFLVQQKTLERRAQEKKVYIFYIELNITK
jgi:hypothetical protein